MRTALVKPITEIKRQTTAVIAEASETRRPVLITDHGRAVAILLDVQTWESMASRLELIDGIARGERDFSAGRVVTDEDVKKRIRRWTRLKR